MLGDLWSFTDKIEAWTWWLTAAAVVLVGLIAWALDGFPVNWRLLRRIAPFLLPALVVSVVGYGRERALRAELTSLRDRVFQAQAAADAAQVSSLPLELRLSRVESTSDGLSVSVNQLRALKASMTDIQAALNSGRLRIDASMIDIPFFCTNRVAAWGFIQGLDCVRG